MKRLFVPFLSLTGILWLTAGWLTWVLHKGVGMVNGIFLGGDGYGGGNLFAAYLC